MPEHRRRGSEDGAGNAALEQRLQRGHGRVVPVLEAHRDAAAGALGDVDQPCRFTAVVSDRLLQQHLRAGLERLDREPCMRVVRRADVHDVGALLTEQLLDVGVAGHPVGGRRCSEAVRIRVAHRHEFGVRHSGDRREVHDGDVAAPDHRRTMGSGVRHRVSTPSAAVSPENARAARPNAAGPENPPSSNASSRCGSREAKPA